MSVYKLDVFKDLIQKYETWDSLKQFLETDEGGFLTVTNVNDDGMCIIRYDKEVSKFNIPHTRWFRSVVWDTIKNRPYSVAVPKTSSNTFPCNTIRDVNDESMVCQELYDGFMINCFRKANNDSIHITSRSKLDATGRFYSDKSFRELFINALSITNGLSKDNFELDDSDDITRILKCYIRHPSDDEISTFSNFLVQHPFHRNVKKIEEPAIFEVQYGRVCEDGTVYITNGNRICQGIPTFDLSSRYENQDMLVSDWTNDIFDERSWQFQGVVFKDRNGNRWRFRSHKFSIVKSLRGNSPSHMTRYTQLYKQNLIKQYIEYYPEDLLFFSVCHANIITILGYLYNYYEKVHIQKTMSIAEVDKMFHPHLYSLHGYYLTNLKGMGKRLDTIHIHEYLVNLPWQRLLFLMKRISLLLNSSA